MSVDGNIFVFQRDGFDGGLAPMAPAGINRHVIETNNSVPIRALMREIVQVRTIRFAGANRVKLTILAHGITESDGRFWIHVADGLDERNIGVVSDLAPLGLVKIVSRACGPIDESAVHAVRPTGYPSMRRLYSEFARVAGTEVIAGERQQQVNIGIRPERVVRTTSWIGTRFVYHPDGSRLGILPSED